jgi:hypothetical protein
MDRTLPRLSIVSAQKTIETRDAERRVKGSVKKSVQKKSRGNGR